MSGSLGELFIELAFQGNTEEAKKFREEMNKTAKELQKVTKEASKNAEEMLKQEKATAKNNKALKNTKSGLTDTITAIGGFIGAVAGAFYAINRLTDSLVASNQQFLNLTRTSDIALSTFQKWDGVGKMFGINNAAEQIKNLNDRLFELKLTGANAEGFMLAGIQPTNAEDVLEQLRNRIKGLDDTSASYIIQKVGLDPQMLHILRLRKEEYDALVAEIKPYQLTEQQRNDIQMMNIQLQIASQKLQYLKSRAILAIMPHFTRFTKSLANIAVLLAKVTKAAADFAIKFRALLLPLGVFIAKSKPVLAFFEKFGAALSKAIIKIPVFGRVLAGMFGTIGKFLGRWLWLLTAIFLLLDDIAVYNEGGESVIGEAIDFLKGFKDFPETQNAIADKNPMQGLAYSLLEINDIIKTLLDNILAIIDAVLGTKLYEWNKKRFDDMNYDERVKKIRDKYHDMAENDVQVSYLPPAGDTSNVNNTNYAPANVYNITVANAQEANEFIAQAQNNELNNAQFYFGYRTVV